MLLVVDNLEQVLGAAPELGRLLARCPHTQLLVTSRRVLRLRGEHDVPLGPLGLPRAGDGGPETIGRGAGRAAVPRPGPAGRPGLRRGRRLGGVRVAEVVRRLEGLPLAIELVAARVRTLPPAVLLRRLDTRPGPARPPAMDVPDRQRTLRATVAWSHDLLDEPERALLARLSVCAGGATHRHRRGGRRRDDDLDVPEVLSSLVGHSLVSPTDTCEGEPRFRMLEVVRSFAAERLRERGEEHADAGAAGPNHLATVSAAAGIGLSGPGPPPVGGPPGRRDRPTCRRPCAGRWPPTAPSSPWPSPRPLARWWWARGLLVPDGRRSPTRPPGCRRRPRSRPGSAGPPAVGARHDAHRARAQVDEAAPLLAAVVDGARERDDPWLLGHGLVGLAMTRPPDDPELPGAVRARRSRRCAAAGTSGRWRSRSCRTATSPCWPATWPAAVRAHEEALALARGIGDDHLVATLLDQLGLDALMSGDAATARRRLGEAAGLHRAIGDQEGLANCLDGLAGLALLHGGRADRGPAVRRRRRPPDEARRRRLAAAAVARDRPGRRHPGGPRRRRGPARARGRGGAGPLGRPRRRARGGPASRPNPPGRPGRGRTRAPGSGPWARPATSPGGGCCTASKRTSGSSAGTGSGECQAGERLPRAEAPGGDAA